MNSQHLQWKSQCGYVCLSSTADSDKTCIKQEKHDFNTVKTTNKKISEFLSINLSLLYRLNISAEQNQ